MVPVQSLKIIFAGTPEFAATALQALLDSPHKIVAVYTQPDRPAGRGRKLTPSAVKALALQHDLPVYQPETLRDESAQAILKSHHADIMVVAAYGLLLPVAVLNAPRLGCINIHASLLPRWRGAAPIQRAVLAGDSETGVTIMQMDKGLDTGDMLHKVTCQILPDDTSAVLHDRLAELGASAVLEALNNIIQNKISPESQDQAQATHAKKITKEEAQIDWHLPASELARQVRAFNSWPVSYTICNNQSLRIWQADALDAAVENNLPGTVTHIAPNEGIRVATKNGFLLLKQIQFPGGKIVSASDILNSHRHDLVVGQVLG